MKVIRWSCTIQIPRTMLFDGKTGQPRDGMRLGPIVTELVDGQALQQAERMARGWGEDLTRLTIEIVSRELDEPRWHRQQQDTTTAQHVPYRVVGTMQRLARWL